MSFPLPGEMPSLNLSIPAERTSTSSVELNEGLLRHWIQRLPGNNLPALAEIYLDALHRFNRNQVPALQRVRLLDLYRQPLNELLFKLSPNKLKQQLPSASKRLWFIDRLTELMNELAIGYKIVVMEAGDDSPDLQRNPLARIAVHRACEQLSYQALHAYKFYQTVPARVFRELHQLYLLSSHAGVAEEQLKVSTLQLSTEDNLKQRYVQIMLLSISNPFGLKSNTVLKAYQILQPLAGVAELEPLRQDHSTAGLFYINCLSDRTPTPTILGGQSAANRPPTLLLNTKPVLVAVDQLFRQATQTETTVDVELLRQLVPYLNTSYKRKQDRIAVVGATEAYMARGLPAVHQALYQHTGSEQLPDPDSLWQILNKNDYGYLLARRDAEERSELNIGDFIGIIDKRPDGLSNARLASIQWLRTDEHQQTKVGLALIEGEPKAVMFTVDSEQQPRPALLIPELARLNRPATLLTTAGVFAADRLLNIKTRKKFLNFTIRCDRLVQCDADIERFTFSYCETPNSA